MMGAFNAWGEREDDAEKGRRGDVERQKMDENRRISVSASPYPRVSASPRSSYPPTPHMTPVVKSVQTDLFPELCLNY
jgi:hypothetical protein